jgi:hypothetical protein
VILRQKFSDNGSIAAATSHDSSPCLTTSTTTTSASNSNSNSHDNANDKVSGNIKSNKHLNGNGKTGAICMDL